MEAIRGAAAGLRIPAQPSPWLAPLPDALLLRDLPAPAGARDQRAAGPGARAHPVRPH